MNVNAVVNFLIGFPALGTVLGLVTAFLVRESTHPGWKGTTTAFLAAVLGFASQVYEHAVKHQAYDLKLGAAVALVGFLAAQATYYGLWKPTGLAKVLQRIGMPKAAAQAVSAKAETTVADIKAKLEAEEQLPADPAPAPAPAPAAPSVVKAVNSKPIGFTLPSPADDAAPLDTSVEKLPE